MDYISCQVVSKRDDKMNRFWQKAATGDCNGARVVLDLGMGGSLRFQVDNRLSYAHSLWLFVKNQQLVRWLFVTESNVLK